jgi:histidinol-phosphate aminotransferase
MNKAFTPKTKMVFIANPDNPTGTYVTRRELERFLDDTPKEVIVFLDEAYFEFAKDLPDYPNGMDYLDRPNIIVTRTFSKAYGLSGLRLGYGISNAQCVGYLDRVREPFNVNILAQYAGCAALEDRAFIRKTLKGIKREKEFLYSALKDLKTRYIPSATNFILIDLGQRDSKTIFHRMLKKGVIVREMSVWGFDTFIRVTIGTRPQNRRFIRALKEILED